MRKQIKDIRTQALLFLADETNKDKISVLECLVQSDDMRDWLLCAVPHSNRRFEMDFWEANVINFGKTIDVCGHMAETNWALESLYPEAYVEALAAFIHEQSSGDNFIVFETADDYPDVYEVADFLEELESDDFKQAFKSELDEMHFEDFSEGNTNQ